MKKTTVIFATSNKHKLQEVKAYLKGLPLTIRDLSSFPQLGEIKETGRTFEENALIKSQAVAKLCPGAIIIADDSGLCVDALNGEPGVRSARYAGPGATYEQLCHKLLGALQGKNNRKAYFISVYSILLPNGKKVFAEGRLYGRIGYELHGNYGFGYDPVFLHRGGRGKTLADLPLAEKNTISHRARALTKVRKVLLRYL